jgi:hypothetical protein
MEFIFSSKILTPSSYTNKFQSFVSILDFHFMKRKLKSGWNKNCLIKVILIFVTVQSKRDYSRLEVCNKNNSLLIII